MAETGVISKPRISGTLAAAGPWQALFAKQGYRVYPYQVGCSVRADSDASAPQTIDTYGMGNFAANDYLIVCTPTSYGDGTLYIPDTSKITKVSSIGTGVDDEIVVTPAISVDQNDWLFNLSVDTSATPLVSPSLDGSDVQLHTDPAGVENNTNPYLVTAQGGTFQGWIETGYTIVDLLITDSSGNIVLAWPGFVPGPSVTV